jgi:hypothetical protein
MWNPIAATPLSGRWLGVMARVAWWHALRRVRQARRLAVETLVTAPLVDGHPFSAASLVPAR